MSYCVYILYSASLDRFYTGMTEDVEKRISHHNNPIFGSKFTSKGVPWTLFLTIACDSKAHALKLERLIKSKKSSAFIKSLKENEKLIEGLIIQSRP